MKTTLLIILLGLTGCYGHQGFTSDIALDKKNADFWHEYAEISSQINYSMN